MTKEGQIFKDDILLPRMVAYTECIERNPMEEFWTCFMDEANLVKGLPSQGKVLRYKEKGKQG